jgi:hypothetical protein
MSDIKIQSNIGMIEIGLKSSISEISDVEDLKSNIDTRLCQLSIIFLLVTMAFSLQASPPRMSRTHVEPTSSDLGGPSH